MPVQGYRSLGRGIDGAVGETPMVELQRLPPPGSARVLVKLEYLNPSGSIKDRAALAAIQDAEERGDLRAGGAIVEATSGNMGLA
ncbi:MAG: pyridoxal-phosphate dependent enzyme, partial [Chloroflexi bacterium]|nr:pyridoxal-phosphate dependent enzyme [Chloroflexota bacterium]